MSFVIDPRVASGVLVDAYAPTPEQLVDYSKNPEIHPVLEEDEVLNLPSPYPSKTYDMISVSDEETKYKSLSESQERHIVRLEEEISRLKEELSSVGDKLVDSVVFSQETSTTVPQGITLPSQFRNGLEAKLREKANQLKEAVK